MQKNYHVVIVADFEITASSEVYWEGIGEAERVIEQAVALILLQLSGDGYVDIQEVVIDGLLANIQ